MLTGHVFHTAQTLGHSVHYLEHEGAVADWLVVRGCIRVDEEGELLLSFVENRAIHGVSPDSQSNGNRGEQLHVMRKVIKEWLWYAVDVGTNYQRPSITPNDVGSSKVRGLTVFAQEAEFETYAQKVSVYHIAGGRRYLKERHI